MCRPSICEIISRAPGTCIPGARLRTLLENYALYFVETANVSCGTSSKVTSAADLWPPSRERRPVGEDTFFPQRSRWATNMSNTGLEATRAHIGRC